MPAGSSRGERAGPLDASIVIAGGGPAGLAAAIHAARAGHDVLLLERQAGIPDKCCGEGLMPRGVRLLDALGVRESIARDQQSPFLGIRYVLESGRAVEGRFREGPGLGIRRVALSEALRKAALGAGARIEQRSLRGFAVERDQVIVETERGSLRASLLVGADGLQSPVRRLAGLDAPEDPLRPAPRRFGLRRHFAIPGWTDLVEVHWQDGAECYVTPAGPEQVNVAFLWEPERVSAAPHARTVSQARAASPARGGGADPEAGSAFGELLARFPRVAERLEGARPLSESRGCGPLRRETLGRAGVRVALVGDAAGYVDAITGQGLSLAFLGADLLVRALPQDLRDARALDAALARYDRSLRSAWTRYALPAQALLALARHSLVRRAALGAAARLPAVFTALVNAVDG